MTTSEEIYRWWIENNKLNDELVSKIQLECFKRVEPVKIISSSELNSMLRQDRRFNNPKVMNRLYWLFDTQYAVISRDLLDKILAELVGLSPWTVVAIVQSVTGLNSGFIAYGRRVENEEFKEEHLYCGFITDKGFVMFDESGKEVGEDEAAVWHLVFD